MPVSSKISLHPQATTVHVQYILRFNQLLIFIVQTAAAPPPCWRAGKGPLKLIQALGDITRKGYAGVDKILFMGLFQVVRKEAMIERGTFFNRESIPLILKQRRGTFKEIETDRLTEPTSGDSSPIITPADTPEARRAKHA